MKDDRKNQERMRQDDMREIESIQTENAVEKQIGETKERWAQESHRGNGDKRATRKRHVHAGVLE